MSKRQELKELFVGTTRRKTMFALVAILPICAWMVAFNIYPMFYAFYISLFRTSLVGLRLVEFIGLRNYRSVLLEDPLFWSSLRRSGAFTGGLLFLHLPVSLLIAIALQSITRSRKGYSQFLQLLYFAPVAAGIVVGVVVFKYLYDPSVGLFNAILTGIGLPRLYYLNDPATALPSLWLITSWRWLGFDVMIFYAGLQAIPSQLYESAWVDGARPLQVLFRVTLPLLRSVMLFLFVTTFIAGIQLFSPAYIVDPYGGKLRSVYLVMLYVYQTAFGEHKVSYASAITYTIFVFVLLLTLVQLRFGRKEWEY